ncbi:MAG: hypothetical protein LBR80_05700 [Deltaproteobacteria bacterium]|jgi:hypothetical protein|nr:hypothetical protein [Deltaproteobacteria bacterium]
MVLHADALYRLERFAEWTPVYGRLVERDSGVLGASHESALAGRWTLAFKMADLVRFEEAAEEFKILIAALTSIQGDDFGESQETLIAMTESALRALCPGGGRERPSGTWKRSCPTPEGARASSKPDTVVAIESLSDALLVAGCSQRALEQYHRLFSALSIKPPDDPAHPRQVKSREGIAGALESLGRLSGASMVLEVLLRVLEEPPQRPNPRSASAHGERKPPKSASCLASVQYPNGDPAASKANYERALPQLDLIGLEELAATVRDNIQFIKDLMERGGPEYLRNRLTESAPLPAENALPAPDLLPDPKIGHVTAGQGARSPAPFLKSIASCFRALVMRGNGSLPELTESLFAEIVRSPGMGDREAPGIQAGLSNLVAYARKGNSETQACILQLLASLRETIERLP